MRPPLPRALPPRAGQRGARVLEVRGSSRQMRDFIHVDDCIRGILEMLDRIEDGSAVNLSTGILTSVRRARRHGRRACRLAAGDPRHLRLAGRRLRPGRLYPAAGKPRLPAARDPATGDRPGAAAPRGSRSGSAGVTIRNIAVFHCTARVGSAWCCAEGISVTLAAMGYRVMDYGHPQRGAPPAEALRQADLIILGAVEWYGDLLLSHYGADWAALPMPKVAWYAELAERDDRDFPFARYRGLADRHYFPAAQDAVAFGGTWLPFGADTVLFALARSRRGTPRPSSARSIRSGGIPRPARHPARPHGAGLRPRPDPLLRAAAEAYASTQVFVNLPAWSRLLVTKVTEVMACGTMLVTPAMDHPSALGNMAQFEDGRHLVYYPPDRPDRLPRSWRTTAMPPPNRPSPRPAGPRWCAPIACAPVCNG